MLFVRDNGGRIHHRSASSQRLERAARSLYRFVTLVTGCLSLPSIKRQEYLKSDNSRQAVPLLGDLHSK
jgi:hypothetical protein